MNVIGRIFCILTVFLFLIQGKNAFSHLNSLSYSTIESTSQSVRVELKLTLICTLELFSVDANNDGYLSKEELEPAKSAMYYYINNKIKVLSGGKQLRMLLRDLGFRVEEEDSYTVFDLEFPKVKGHDEFVMICNVIEETDPYHRNLAEIKVDDEEYLFVFTNMNYFDSKNPPRGPMELDTPVAAPSSLPSATQ